METFGKYQLVRRLGAGGMAEVFLARSAVAQGLAKLLVIKKIHPAFAKSKHFVRMFVDEAKIALGLNHPNIVQVFDFGHVAHTYFLAMEYVEGADLLRVMQEGAKLQRRVPYGLCAYIVQQVAKGLDYAHRKTDEYGEDLSIVHRDISPQNVLISWDGSVKIVDFGIARARDVQEEEGVVKGKFAYMSPEQARGLPVDRRSDVFSAGIVLYELAVARPLFTGKGKEVLESVRAGAIPRPRDVDPHLPPQLEEILLKSLAYHADDRYQTARDLQNALGRFQFQFTQNQNELFDSSTLAQFVAQTVPREKRARGSTDSGMSTPGVSAVSTPPPTPAPISTPAPPASVMTPAVAATVAVESRERKHVLVVEGVISGSRSDGDKSVVDFRRMAENIAYKHEAVLHSSQGPAFVYLVGIPATGEDDASRAIRLGLALIDVIDGIGRDSEPDLRLSVGIHRGVAVVARKGGAQWSYELTETTTSFARKLAEEAKAGEVLVGGAVFRVARNEWNFDELATIDLIDDADTSPTNAGSTTDGGTRRAKIYRLRGPKEREQRMRERAVTEELVGRDLELKALRDAFRNVAVNRVKHHVLIIGEEGLGKRSLVAAFLKGLPQGEAMVLRAACRAVTQDAPFSVVADLARDLLGLAEGAEPKEILRRLQATAAMLYLGDLESREVQSLVETIGLLLGIRGEDLSVDADERRARILAAMRKIEERLSKDQQLIVAVDDVHWADSQSWDVFMDIIGEAATRPVLGIATARPDERIVRAARTAVNTTVIYLNELDAEDRVKLVQDRFVPGDDSKQLADEIVAKAGGNPFFIREVFDSLIERGILAERGGGKVQWVKRDVQLQVPTSVSALVASRLDRLSAAEKEVLSRAAVFGREFAAADVAALVGRLVEEELAALEHRHLIEIGAHAHAFRNQITQTVAYDLVPIDERAQLHKRAAERLAASPGYRAGQDDAVIGRHLERAGDRTTAAQRYFVAAQHARDVRGNVEAFRLLTRAIALLPRNAHAERFTARAERETILRAWAQRPQQLRELHHLRREAEGAGDAGKLAEALTRLGLFYYEVGKTNAAKQTLGPALEAARRAQAPLAEAEVLRVQAVLARSSGENAEALVLADRALALCGESRPGLLQRAQILNNKGTILWHLSRLREAILAHSEALVIYRNLRVPRQEARALNNMGIVFSALGEFEEALAHYKRALKIDHELGDRVSIALKLANIGAVYVDLGDADKAEQYLVKAIGIAEQIKDPGTQTDASITLGQTYLKRGEFARARKLFERGLHLAADSRSRYQEIRAMVYLALAKLQAGDPPATSVQLTRRAGQLAKNATLPIGEIFALAVEGLALGKLGLASDAADRAAEAVRLLDAAKATEGADEILFIHAQLARAAGRDAEAAASLSRAHADLMSKARRLKDPGLRAAYLGSQHAREVLAEVASYPAPG